MRFPIGERDRTPEERSRRIAALQEDVARLEHRLASTAEVTGLPDAQKAVRRVRRMIVTVTLAGRRSQLNALIEQAGPTAAADDTPDSIALTPIAQLPITPDRVAEPPEEPPREAPADQVSAAPTRPGTIDAAPVERVTSVTTAAAPPGRAAAPRRSRVINVVANGLMILGAAAIGFAAGRATAPPSSGGQAVPSLVAAPTAPPALLGAPTTTSAPAPNGSQPPTRTPPNAVGESETAGATVAPANDQAELESTDEETNEEDEEETNEEGDVPDVESPPVLETGPQPSGPPTAVLLAPGFTSVNVRQAPDAAAPLIRTIPVETTVALIGDEVLGDGLGWQQMRTAEGEFG